MVNEIKQKYQQFGDATIDSVSYNIFSKDRNLERQLEVNLTCLNWITGNWETIKLEFENVKAIRLIEGLRTVSVVFEALIMEEDGTIIFDFFPIQIDDVTLEEDPNSDFSIKSESVKYSVIR